MTHLPRLVIAAPSSGSGKSMIASGLMAAFARRLTVQGFKVGPDYIDPMYHTAATGRPARNLDSWMLPHATVLRGFLQASQGADLAIIEGVMGLFDGFDTSPLTGSTAEIANLLSAPLILVIDCARMSGSAAAVVHGFHTFMPALRLSGVICNRVGSDRHAAWLREAIERLNLPVLGCIPRLPNLQIPERHLGLFTVAERPEAVKDFLNAAADAMEQYLDLSAILSLAGQAVRLEAEPEAPVPIQDRQAAIRLAIAADEAFCFYYEDNLDELRHAGAEIIPFSPLSDKHLPPGISGLYLGGGYPELYAAQLSANHSLLTEIRSAHRRSMPIYAECGGLMYLTEGIHLPHGDYPLAGILPNWSRMADHLNMGYREVEIHQPGLFGLAGDRLRGHEFHYSQWDNPAPHQSAYRVSPRHQGSPPRLDGYVCGNLHAAYIHLHFGQRANLAGNLVQICRQWQNQSHPGAVA